MIDAISAPALRCPVTLQAIQLLLGLIYQGSLSHKGRIRLLRLKLEMGHVQTDIIVPSERLGRQTSATIVTEHSAALPVVC